MLRTTETYVPLSRGLLEHLHALTPAEVKTYVALLILASPFTSGGRERGCVTVSQRELGEHINMFPSQLSRTMKSLVDSGYIEVLESGVNRWRPSRYRITKYKSVRNFTAHPSDHDTDHYSGHECESTVNGVLTLDAEDASNDASSGAPNNIDNVDNGENISTAERNILNSLKSLPSYPFDFEKDLKFLRQLLIDFPDVSDIAAELKSTAAWLLDHKAPKNYRLFIRNWIKKSSEYGRNENGRNMEGNGRSAGERTRGGGKYSPPSPRGDFTATGVVTDW